MSDDKLDITTSELYPICHLNPEACKSSKNTCGPNNPCTKSNECCSIRTNECGVGDYYCWHTNARPDLCGPCTHQFCYYPNYYTLNWTSPKTLDELQTSRNWDILHNAQSICSKQMNLFNNSEDNCMSNWTDCRNNQRSREKIPPKNGATCDNVGNLPIVQDCSDCIPSIWTDCSDNKRTRTITKYINSGICAETDTEQICSDCKPSWTDCLNNRRTRTITPATNGGRDCTQIEIENKTEQDCSNCVFTGKWTDCSNGKRTKIIIPATNGGKDCTETEQSCSNCVLGVWSSCSRYTPNKRSRAIKPATNGGTCAETETSQTCSNCYLGALTNCLNGKRTKTIIPEINGGTCDLAKMLIDQKKTEQTCSDCILGPWTECSNGKRTRTITPATNGGTCAETETLQYCKNQYIVILLYFCLAIFLIFLF
jgi:hypothetical protein